MEIKCPVCLKAVDEKLFEYHLSTEEHLLKKIVDQYPAWSGNREKVLWYYRNFVREDCACEQIASKEGE